MNESTPHYFQTYIGDDDLALIHRLGVRCVRLSIDPGLLYSKAAPAVPDPLMLGYVDTAVHRILAHDLAAIIDLHDDPAKPVEQDPDYASGFAQFWRVLAHHFSGWNPDMVYLEALNEPVFEHDPQRWLSIQRQFLIAMRAGAPRLTLIATGPLWSSVAGLLLVKPAPLSNVVYTFHFYEPATFTHQGAQWWVDGLDRYLSQLPYPTQSRPCTAAMARFTNVDVRASARAYCAGGWNAAKLGALIAQAAHWSTVHRVPIFAGEFGVYCQQAPPVDRLRWFKDVRVGFQRYGIGWNLWGYDDCYGLGRHRDAQGHLAIDWQVAQALGLNTAVPAARRPPRPRQTGSRASSTARTGGVGVECASPKPTTQRDTTSDGVLQ